MSTIPLTRDVLAFPPRESLPKLPSHSDSRAVDSTWLQRLTLQLGRVFWLACLLFSAYVFTVTNSSRIRQMQDLFATNSAAFEALGISRAFLPPYILIFDTLAFAVYAFIGSLIFWRKAEEWSALFGSLALVTAGITISRPTDSMFFIQPELRLPVLLLLTLGTGSILLFLFLFPDGRFAPHWLALAAIIASGWPVIVSVQQILSLSTSTWPPPVIAPAAVPAVLLAVAAQVYRYRRAASDSRRQQTKWVLYGLGIAAAAFVGYFLVVPGLLPRVLDPGTERALYIFAGIPLFKLSLMLLPLSIGASILRHRLWDIDLLIRHSVLYVSLTAIVAGLFASTITFGQRIFQSVTGQHSDVSAVIATLLVVSMITPLKDYLQKYVDRCFRTGCEPGVHLKAFIERVNARVSPVDPDRISHFLVDEIVTAFDAKGAGVYWEASGNWNRGHRSGEWNGDGAMTVPLQADERKPQYGVVAVGERRDGRPYNEADKAILLQAASAVAWAIEQDRSWSGSQ